MFDSFFEPAHVLIVENGFDDGKIPKWEAEYSRLSQGAISPEEIRRHSKYDSYSDAGFLEKLQEKIEFTRKRILFERSPLTTVDLQKWKQEEETLEEVLKEDKTLEEVLEAYEQNLMRKAKDLGKRNEVLAFWLEKFTKRHSASRVMLIIGAGHQRGLEGRLRTVPFTTAFMTSPFICELQADTLSDLELNQQSSRETMMRTLMEFFEKRDLERNRREVPYSERARLRQRIDKEPIENVKRYLEAKLV